MVEDNITVNDDIGKEMIASQAEHLKKEIELFENGIIDHDKTIARFNEQWATEKEMYELMIANMGAVEPQVKYETLPRYWELKSLMTKYKFEQTKAQAEGFLKNKEVERKGLVEQLESAKNKLAELGVSP